MPEKNWTERVMDVVERYGASQVEARAQQAEMKASNVEAQQRYDAQMPTAFERFAGKLESVGFSVSRESEHLALNARLDRPPISFHAVAQFHPSTDSLSMVELSAGTDHNDLDRMNLPPFYSADDVVTILGDHLADRISLD